MEVEFKMSEDESYFFVKFDEYSLLIGPEVSLKKVVQHIDHGIIKSRFQNVVYQNLRNLSFQKQAL